MNNRLFQKIFFTVAISIFVGIMLVLVLFSVSVSSYLVNEKEESLTNNCRTISNVLSTQTINTEGFYISLDGVVRVVSNTVLGDVYVCDAEGHIFLCSCKEYGDLKACDHSKGVVDSEIIQIAEQKGSYFEVGHLNKRLNNIYYTAATPFYNADKTTAGYVFISSPASQLKEMWSKLSNVIVWCAFIPIVMTFVFLYFMIGRITKPVKLMSKAAVDMSKGDFSNRIPVEGHDEISELAEAFNTMSNSLAQLEGMRRSFIANISHELRTPMTTIGGFIDGILDGTIPPEQQNYYLSIVSSETERLSRLVRTMLDLAKLESGEMKVAPKEFSPVDLIIQVLSMHEQRIESKNIDIQGLDCGSDIKAFADPDLMYQVIYNLTDNAIKFTPENGYICYSVQSDKDVGTVSIKIRNSGKGIDPKDMQFIFDRFYKTDKSRSANKEGTGLGLYIVKTIVDIHKGNITVSCKPDEYTEFLIVLPQQF